MLRLAAIYGQGVAEDTAVIIALFGGPSGAGKSTLARKWCATRSQAAHIELDEIRHLIVSGRTDPQETSELQAEQYQLSVNATCALARAFAAGGCDVAIDDVFEPDAFDRYWRPQLDGLPWKLVVSSRRSRRRSLGRRSGKSGFGRSTRGHSMRAALTGTRLFASTRAGSTSTAASRSCSTGSASDDDPRAATRAGWRPARGFPRAHLQLATLAVSAVSESLQRPLPPRHSDGNAAPAEGATRMKTRLFSPENRKWWTLVAVAVGLFMIMLDNTVVNVALPSIQQDLGMSPSELEWVFNAYALTFGVLLLSGGKLADMLGRRRIFIAGLVIFTAASLWCGLAGGAASLISARTVQGVGAALMNPATLSIITATFPPRQRGTAIGIWAGVSALALAIGPLLGGVLTEDAGWSWIFFINIPVGVAGVLAARIFIDESRDTSREQRLDLPGLTTSAVGLFALTYGLIETNDHAWGSARVLTLFAIAVVALGLFILLELRQRHPMLDMTLFRNPTFSGSNTVMFLVGLAMFGILFYNSLYLQRVLGYSAIKTGATFLPLTVLIILVAPVAGKLSDRIGPRWLMGGGMTLLAASLLLFGTLGVASTWWDIVPGLVVGGLGMAITMAPTTAAAMGSVPVDKAGVGSAVINSMRQVGGSLGIALMGTLVATTVSVAPLDPRYPAEFVPGYHRALHVGAAILLAGAVIAVLTVRKVRPAEQVAHEPAVGT
jgi:EmrB/QacA subfamily drug resistance transporter